MFHRMIHRTFMSAVVVLITTSAIPSSAQENRTLSIGMAAVVTTLDPHEDSNSPNNSASRHIFDSLINRGGSAENKPQLATSWEALDDTHWRFTLREGVTFHDGSTFDSEDVVASLTRVQDKESQSFASYTRNIANVTADGPYAVIVETTVPDPLILNSLSRVRIISSEHAESGVAGFENGASAVGTGPYKLASYTPGDHIKLERNEDYFDGPSEWSHVTIRMVPDSGGRLASLLAGDLDLIESLPAEGLTTVEQNDNLQVINDQSSRFVFLGMNVTEEGSPYITAKDGSQLDKNPLKDKRVREALLMAINRDAIVDRVMQRNGTVAHQFVSEGYFGHSDQVEEVGYDLEHAKQLLAEAGYPNGFSVMLHGPSGRYVNDSQVLQAIGQMFSRIGINTEIQVMPWSVFSARRTKDNFAIFLSSWGVNTGEVSNPALAVVAANDPDKGTGRYNNGYVDVYEINELLDEATATLDDASRESMLRQVSELTFNDLWLLPLHYENVVMGARKGIDYTPRSDQYTLAYEIFSAE